jgi:hypothetical protein
VCGVESRERHAAVRGRHVKRVEQVLDGDRNAQQWALRTSPAGDVSRPRLFNRVARDDLVRVEAKLPLVVDFDQSEIACVIFSEVVTPDIMSERNSAMVLPTTSYLVLGVGFLADGIGAWTTSRAFPALKFAGAQAS